MRNPVKISAARILKESGLKVPAHLKRDMLALIDKLSDDREPQRVKLSRLKGSKMPANTVKVDRTGKWGNPFTVPERLKGEAKNKAQAEAVKAFTEALESETLLFSKEDIRRELKGKNLACWCRPGTPCHAEVLLSIANQEGGKP